MSHIFHPSMGFMAQNIAYASQNVIKIQWDASGRKSGKLNPYFILSKNVVNENAM